MPEDSNHDYSPVKGATVLVAIVIILLTLSYFAVKAFTALQYALWVEDKVAEEVDRRWREELPPGTCLFFDTDGTVRWMRTEPAPYAVEGDEI